MENAFDELSLCLVSFFGRGLAVARECLLIGRPEVRNLPGGSAEVELTLLSLESV